MVWMTRVALELIGQGGLGYSFDNMGEEGANEYGKAAKAMMYVRAPVPSLLIRPYMYLLTTTPQACALCDNHPASVSPLGFESWARKLPGESRARSTFEACACPRRYCRHHGSHFARDPREEEGGVAEGRCGGQSGSR